MSPADSADRPGPLRVTYSAELEQLRLQIEVMGVLVDQNLERMRQVLETGDPASGRARPRRRRRHRRHERVAHRALLRGAGPGEPGRRPTCGSWCRSSGSSASSSGSATSALRVVKLALDHDLLAASPGAASTSSR